MQENSSRFLDLKRYQNFSFRAFPKVRTAEPLRRGLAVSPGEVLTLMRGLQGLPEDEFPGGVVLGVKSASL